MEKLLIMSRVFDFNRFRYSINARVVCFASILLTEMAFPSRLPVIVPCILLCSLHLSYTKYETTVFVFNVTWLRLCGSLQTLLLLTRRLGEAGIVPPI